MEYSIEFKIHVLILFAFVSFFFYCCGFQKRLLMDLDISMRSSACPYTVHFYGALFREGDVWICMEVMDTSLDKFYPKVYKNGQVISEDILGKVQSFFIFSLFFLSNFVPEKKANIVLILDLDCCSRC